MSGILRLESLTKGNTLRQGDLTLLKYRLFDADGDKLDISGKSATIRLMKDRFTFIAYEKEGLAVAPDDTISFSINKILPAGLYHLEVIVDDKYIFPSRDDEGEFNVDLSTLGADINIVEATGVEAVARKATGMMKQDEEFIDDMIENVISNTNVGNIETYYNQFNEATTEFESLKTQAINSVTKSDKAIADSASAKSIAQGIDAKATNALELSESADTLSKSVQEQFNQVVIDGDSSVESAQARVSADGVAKATLKQRLDDDYNEVTTQLEQMVTINVKNFGAVSDADYLNPSDNRYYSDPSFTTLATDNAGVFLDILRFSNRSSGKIKILFPEGNYYSSRMLEIRAEYVHIEGIHAKLITSTPNANTEMYCVYVRECKVFRCNGMTFENIIEDKSVVSASASRFYHIWIRGDGVNKLEYCNITDNVFVDSVSIPNSTNKAYNGSIWISSARNVFVSNNKFYNSCGRVIYIASSENINIHSNLMENVGFKHEDVTNVSVGTLLVRLISVKNAKVYNNSFVGTEVYNPLPSVVYGVLLAHSSGSLTHSEDVQIISNFFKTNESYMKAIHMDSVKNSTISDNDVELNNTNPDLDCSFISTSILDRDDERVSNIKVTNNRITKAHENSLDILTTASDINKFNITLIGNTFDSDTLLTRLSSNRNGMTSSLVGFIDNYILKDNVPQYEMVTWSGIDYNSLAFRRMQITQASFSTHIKNGVLTVPNDVKIVSFNTSTPLTITDVTINGEYQDNRILEFVNMTTTEHTFKNNSLLMRLENGTDKILPTFGSIRLVYMSNRWYQLS